MRTTYISVDIETDGNIPGVHTLLSLGAAAFTLADGQVSTFSANLEKLEGAISDPETMKFWALWPGAYEATRVNTVPPEFAMREFVAWYSKLENPVFVFYPTKFDGLWLYYFLYRFGGKSFVNSPDTIDIKTFALCMFAEESTTRAGKRDWPKRWKSKKRHKHIALSDAIEQGESFMKMLQERLNIAVNSVNS